MSKTYTFKEANELIKKYSKLLNQLVCSKEYVEKYKKKIFNDASFLLKKSFFQDKQLADFRAGSALESNYNDIELLIKSMYCYFKSKDLYLNCENLYSNYSEEINKNIEQLRKGQNIIKWIFSNSSHKENAEESYEYLKNMLNSDFFINSNNVLNSFIALEKVNKTDVYNHVEEDVFSYRQILFELYPEIIKIGYNNSAIENINKELETILSQRDRITQDIEKEKLEIKKQLEVLISQEMMNMLREIPVEELNRSKNGIRVKTLRDCGYKTIADVYTASIKQIEEIQGISYSAATNIHSLAIEFAKETANNVKIKLSVDNKNVVSTNVVRLLSKYINKKNCSQQCDNLINEYKPEIDQNLNKLLEVANGIKYYFSSVEEKNKYIESYVYLKDVVYGEKFGALIKQLVTKYFLVKEPNSELAWKDFSESTIKYYNAIEEIYPGLLGNDDVYYGLPEDLAKKIQEENFYTDGLLCTLRHYQEIGVKYILRQGKVLLGDEMGLGKTVQAIATMVSLKNTGATHFMVVCPASVVTNWCREVSKHSILTPVMIHGKNRASALQLWKSQGGVAVTTYETTQFIDLDDNFKYSLLVVDEAHYIKNPEAQRSTNTEKIAEKADRILFMTGTALENKVDEMINLIRILNKPIADKIKNIAYLSSAPKFREMVAPVYYRRKRDDVLTELPELIETQEWCEMSKQEEKIYEDSVLNGSFPEIRRLSWNALDLNNSSKAIRLKELIEDAREDDRKIIVFSFFLNTIQRISEYLGDICTVPITGAISSEKRQEIIDEFEKAPAGTVLLSQIIAGGTGLNIQSASVVIICEPQFKPSIENQAISRAYRMGQSRNVLVYRLLCENTIDEKITDLLEEKQKIFDEFADKSVAAEKSISVEVNEKAFGDIIKEEQERISERREMHE